MDRFRFVDQDGHGTFFCGQGGNGTVGGDGFALIQHANHCDHAAATLAEKFMQMGKNSTAKTDKTPTDADWVVNGFTARQVIRRNWKGLTNPEAVQNALEILVEDHWLWMEDVPATVYGGRPTQRYWINPKIFS